MWSETCRTRWKSSNTLAREYEFIITYIYILIWHFQNESKIFRILQIFYSYRTNITHSIIHAFVFMWHLIIIANPKAIIWGWKNRLNNDWFSVCADASNISWMAWNWLYHISWLFNSQKKLFYIHRLGSKSFNSLVFCFKDV